MITLPRGRRTATRPWRTLCGKVTSLQECRVEAAAWHRRLRHREPHADSEACHAQRSQRQRDRLAQVALQAEVLHLGDDEPCHREEASDRRGVH